jgi:hypothetical protein
MASETINKILREELDSIETKKHLEKFLERINSEVFHLACPLCPDYGQKKIFYKKNNRKTHLKYSCPIVKYKRSCLELAKKSQKESSASSASTNSKKGVKDGNLESSNENNTSSGTMNSKENEEEDEDGNLESFHEGNTSSGSTNSKKNEEDNEDGNFENSSDCNTSSGSMNSKNNEEDDEDESFGSSCESSTSSGQQKNRLLNHAKRKRDQKVKTKLEKETKWARKSAEQVSFQAEKKLYKSVEKPKKKKIKADFDLHSAEKLKKQRRKKRGKVTN